ncbi:MAG: galactokinase [Actinobacteria bacterium]|nr:galactokinase [Actinomycetota bacterium]
MRDLIDRALRHAALALGGKADVVARGPGRVNLIGEHTDYNSGLALPFAIGQATVVAVRERTDDLVIVSSDQFNEPVRLRLDQIRPGQVPGWAAYPLGALWGLLGAGVPRDRWRGFEASFVSDVPSGAGLSSSAAIECALLVALDHLWGLGLDSAALAAAGQRGENDVAGAPTGVLDQTAVLNGRREHAVLVDARSGDVELVPLRLACAGLVLAVVDTGVSHAHSTGGYAARRASCERAAAQLGMESLRELGVEDLAAASAQLGAEDARRVRHVVGENARVLETVNALGVGDLDRMGGLMTASHVSLRDDFEVSCSELDLAVEASLAAGALGARMTGGGFGGSAIALVREADLEAVETAVRSAFDRRGFGPPRVFSVQPEDGAAVVIPADSR